LLGVLEIVAGFAVLKGQTWARVVGIVLACLSMIANFGFIPHYPSACVPRNSGALEAMILALSCGNASRHASEACL